MFFCVFGDLLAKAVAMLQNVRDAFKYRPGGVTKSRSRNNMMGESYY